MPCTQRDVNGGKPGLWTGRRTILHTRAVGPARLLLVDDHRAIRAVLAGETRRAGRGREASRPDGDPVARLTVREREVLGLLVAGLDRSAIGAPLFLSPNTVRTHIQNVLRKLEVHSSIEAVGLALRHGVRPPTPDT